MTWLLPACEPYLQLAYASVLNVDLQHILQMIIWLVSAHVHLFAQPASASV